MSPKIFPPKNRPQKYAQISALHTIARTEITICQLPISKSQRIEYQASGSIRTAMAPCAATGRRNPVFRSRKRPTVSRNQTAASAAVSARSA